MVLELKLPEHVAEKGLVGGLLIPLSPKLVSYAMSFLVVVIMWGNHHALMATVRDATRAIQWQNNLLLFWMSLIPFATGFLGENPHLSDAYAVYGFVLAGSCAAFLLLRWYASAQGQDDAALAQVHRTALMKSLLGTLMYALAIPLAYHRRARGCGRRVRLSTLPGSKAARGRADQRRPQRSVDRKEIVAKPCRLGRTTPVGLTPSWQRRLARGRSQPPPLI